MGYDDVRFLAVDELRELLGRIDGASLERLVGLLAQAPRVFLLGAGRSGLAMRGFAMRLVHLGKSAHVVGEATAPALHSGDLLVVGSGSGATASLLAVCERAKGLGAAVALVTTARESPIGRLAGLTVEIPTTTPKRAGAPSDGPSAEAPSFALPGRVVSRQPMATLFEQALWLLADTIILMLMERTHMSAEEMFARHANLE